MRSAFAIARLAAREAALPYAALGLAAGLAASGTALLAPAANAAARARSALGYGLDAAELFAVAAAALAAATGLRRELDSGRAATLLVRPLPRLSYAAGRFLGALAAAAAVAVAAAAVALGAAAVAASQAPEGLSALAPHDEIVPPGSPRFALATGEEQGWTFAPPAEFRAGGRATLRIRPRYQLVERGDAQVPGAVVIRVTPYADGRRLPSMDVHAGTLAPALVPLPPEALAAAQARLVLEPLTPGAIVGFGPDSLALRGPPRSLLAPVLAAVAGIVAAAAFAAALALPLAILVSDWTAALTALTLAAAAGSPETIRAFAHAPGRLPGALRRAIEGFAAALPDLGALDLTGPLLDGRAVPALDALRAIAWPGPIPYVAALVVLAAFLLSAREPGLGRPMAEGG